MNLDRLNLRGVSPNTVKAVSENSNLLKDTPFKAIFTEPKVAVNLVQSLIPFLDSKNRNLDDILKDSITTYKFYDTELKGIPLKDRMSSIIDKSNETLTNAGKLFRHDVLFDYKIGDGEKDIYTINFEMQQKDKKYDMLERALCYAVSILSNILEVGDEYTKLHKVYSIWFLNFNYFDDDIAVHSIAPRVYHNSKSDALTNNITEQTNPEYNQNADLLEVVFIELKKRDKIRNATNLKNLLDVICDNKQKTNTLKTLLNLSDEEVKAMIKQTTFVDDMKEEGREEGIEQGREQGIKQGRDEERRKIIQNMFSKGFSIKQIAEVISVSENVVKSYL